MRFMRKSSLLDTPRRIVLGEAVKVLRGRLEVTQAKFAQILDVDAGTVSRWERGDLAPTQRKCQALAVLARKKGVRDIAAVFADPLKSWMALYRSFEPYRMDQITALEIVTVNANILFEDIAAQRLLQQLDIAVESLTKLLIKHVAEGEEMRLLDEAQQTLWLDTLERHGLKKQRQMTPAQRTRALDQMAKLSREVNETIFKKVKANGKEGTTR
jgi:DNA-binding transcriptional regulator YiaG